VRFIFWKENMDNEAGWLIILAIALVIIFGICVYCEEEPKPRITITYTTTPDGKVTKTETIKPAKRDKSDYSSTLPLMTTMMAMNMINSSQFRRY